MAKRKKKEWKKVKGYEVGFDPDTRLGRLDAPYDRLVELLGEPTYLATLEDPRDYKTDACWDFENRKSWEMTVSIYSYKGPLYKWGKPNPQAIDEWHYRAHSKWDVVELIRERGGEFREFGSLNDWYLILK